MYLHVLHIENLGPLKRIGLDLPFTSNGLPKPVVLVGGNGSGKTTLLSIVADAIFEAAATHYVDTVRGVRGTQRPWFRVVGGPMITLGAPWSFAILEFLHNGTSYFFKEKSGRVSQSEVAARLPERLRGAARWIEDGNVKNFAIAADQVQNVFDNGVYAYFPSSRAETPHWLNRDSVTIAEFDTSARIGNELRKPIFVDKGIDRLEQWLLSLILDARVDVIQGPDASDGLPRFQLLGDPARCVANASALGVANDVLQRVLNDSDAKFAWLGRHAGHKIGIASKNELVISSLDALSAGQATLLGIFGTILRYADNPRWSGALPAQEVTGMCLIDEIDAHMHVDLQYRAVPELLRLFPKMQFIVSCHSPLFLLGMEKVFGQDDVAILEMPSATPTEAEAYAEFGRALQALHDTKAFAAAIAEVASKPGKLLVFLEGETDPLYMIAAVGLLSRKRLMDMVEFEWVGAKDPKNGQGFHTGRAALDQTLTVLRAKPNLVHRPVVLLYDNDAGKPDARYGQVHVRSMPTNPDNVLVESGIENLFPSSVFTSDMYSQSVKRKKNGEITTIRSLDKMKLCLHLCTAAPDPSNFEGFSPILDAIEALLENA